jgi:hypothetical protein
MDIAMPEADAIKALARIDIGDLQPGDILTFSKESPLQKVFWAVNDLWVHSALVVEVDGELRTAEVGTAKEVYSRPIAVAARRYDITGVARPDLAGRCVDHAVSWAAAMIGTAQEYAWCDFTLAALVALTRKGLPAEVLDDLGAAMQEVASKSDAVMSQSRTCAGFVHEALEQGGDGCGLSVAMRDTARLGWLESTVSYSDLLEMSEAEQSELLRDATLYDLIAAEPADTADGGGGPVAEAMNGSRISASQFGRAMRTAFEIVATFAGQSQGEDDGVPGRWVSPTDLWRSDRIGLQGRLDYDSLPPQEDN